MKVETSYPLCEGKVAQTGYHLSTSATVPLVPATKQPLRKDAERNRQRILEAARELFAERGLGVTLNDIAHHAGVGVGTVYRRFPDKEPLIETLFQEQLDEWQRLFEEGLADPDPWQAIVTVHERALELWARNRGLKEIVLGSPNASKRGTKQRAQLHPFAAKLIERAQSAGLVRPDATTQDFGVVLMMVAAVMDAAEDVDPELWRRYLRIALQGLRAEGAPLEPLLVQAVEPTQMDELLVGIWKRRRR
jgi:AcrR family transcriptional regulator